MRNLKSTDLMAASQLRTVSGQTSGFAVKFSKDAAARIDVTQNLSSLIFYLESSSDNADWAVVYTMSALSSGQIGKVLLAYPVNEGYVRVRWKITGTSATFSVKLARSE